jgi:transposase
MQGVDNNLIEAANPEYLKQLVLFLLEKVEQLSVEVSGLKIENAELKVENAELKIENAELKVRLNQNSQNSSRPPSSDGYGKIVKNAKKEATKLRGGQLGHKGNTQHQIDNPDQIVPCCPSRCSCGHEFIGQEELVLHSKRQVFEIPPPRLFVTEYQILGCKCPECGKINQGKTPSYVNSAVQYGNMVKALVVLLNNEYKMPIQKIGEFFKILYGYNINESTIVTMLGSCYDKLLETETIIKEKIKHSEIGHVDETGIRIEKKLNWLHVFSTQWFTYLFAHPKRGKEAIEGEQSIIPEFKNWLVHDCWNSYFNFNQAKHAICNAHIIRELQSAIENDKNETDCWAKEMQDFLIKLHNMDFSQRIQNQAELNNQYLEICEQGLAAQPPPIKQKHKRGKIKNSKARNLLLRLIKHKNSVLAFAFNQNVPFTNNLAERDLRPAKIKLKISNVFRSNNGANYYARIQGFISTTRKNSENILEQLYNTFNRYNFITNPV